MPHSALTPQRTSIDYHQAVMLGAQGRYLASWWLLERIRRREHLGVLASLTWSTQGSHLRQVGAIAEATRSDSRALELAADVESTVEAHLGLAADSIADGRCEGALQHLELAEFELGADRGGSDSSSVAQRGVPGGRWRLATRAAWVRSELMLLQGRIDAAIDSAERAVRLCGAHSLRHQVKSQAILAAGLNGRGDADEAALLVGRIAGEVRRHGWASLAWPIALIALDADTASGGSGSDSQVREITVAGAHATWSIEAHLPDDGRLDLAARWRARSDVGRLRTLSGG